MCELLLDRTGAGRLVNEDHGVVPLGQDQVERHRFLVDESGAGIAYRMLGPEPVADDAALGQRAKIEYEPRLAGACERDARIVLWRRTERVLANRAPGQ